MFLGLLSPTPFHPHFAMLIMNRIEEARENGMMNFEETLKIGTELWTLLPPNHKRVAGYFQRLIETGIYARSLKENRGMLTSVMVQDRNRFVSKTRLRPGRYSEKVLNGLKKQLQKKFWKVFILYGLCILVCFIEMAVESAYGFKKKTKVVKLKVILTSKQVAKLQVALKWYRPAIRLD